MICGETIFKKQSVMLRKCGRRATKIVHDDEAFKSIHWIELSPVRL